MSNQATINQIATSFSKFEKNVSVYIDSTRHIKLSVPVDGKNLLFDVYVSDDLKILTVSHIFSNVFQNDPYSRYQALELTNHATEECSPAYFGLSDNDVLCYCTMFITNDTIDEISRCLLGIMIDAVIYFSVALHQLSLSNSELPDECKKAMNPSENYRLQHLFDIENFEYEEHDGGYIVFLPFSFGRFSAFFSINDGCLNAVTESLIKVTKENYKDYAKLINKLNTSIFGCKFYIQNKTVILSVEMPISPIDFENSVFDVMETLEFGADSLQKELDHMKNKNKLQ